MEHEESIYERAAVLNSVQWPTGTRVQLCQVPWDSAYRDVVAFDSESSRSTWFETAPAGASWVNESFSYLRPGVPIKVPVPYSNVYLYNYLTVTNPAQPVDDEGRVRTLYYFLTGSEYLSPQTTRLTIQLDVITTYQFGLEFGMCYLDSGHAGMANTALQFDSPADVNPQALQRYASVPDGFDTGDRYNPCSREWVTMQGEQYSDRPKIVVVSTTDLAADPGTIDNPNLKCADGQYVDDIVSGCNVYTMHGDGFRALMAAAKEYPWVTQGIIGIYAFPGSLLTDGPLVDLLGGKVPAEQGEGPYFCGETDTLQASSTEFWESDNIFERLSRGIPAPYKNIWKLYTYPYCVVELSTYTGQSLFLKPEHFVEATASLYYTACCLEPFARVAIFPRNYGRSPSGDSDDIHFTSYGVSEQYDTHGALKKMDSVIPAGDFLDNAIYIQDFPQFSIVNNSYLVQLASSAHTRQYNYDSAGWTYKRSNAQASLDYTQGKQSIANAQANQEIENQRQNTNQGATQLHTVNSGVLNTAAGIGQALTGNPAGITNAGLGVGNAVNDFQYQQDTFNSNYAAMNQTFANNQGLATRVNNQNFALATYANTGDYANAIAGINASVQDAALTPPSKVGQMGGDGFSWKARLCGFSVTFKVCAESALIRAGQYFLRFGYPIHQFARLGTLQDMRVMSKFSFWKLTQTYITAAQANEGEKDAIRGIFETGTTVWNSPDDIGKTTLEDNHVIKTVEF